MKYSSILVVKSVCWAIAAFAGLFAAWFELRDRWQTKDDRHLTRHYYRKIWQNIQQTGLLLLPEKVIVSFLTAKTALVDKLWDFFDSQPVGVIKTFCFISPLIGIAVGWITSGWILALVFGATLATFSIILILAIQSTDIKPKNIIIAGILAIAMYIAICLSGVAAGMILLKIVLDLNISLATLIMVVLFPVYAFFFGIPLLALAIAASYSDKTVNNLFVAGMAMAASFSVTLIALLVGHVADPTCWVPKTMQMLVSNVIFDGLTMLATILILTQAVPPRRRISIPLAVCLDVVVAAIFACTSLYCGVAFTERHLGIVEVARVLVALSPDGGHFEIGPYFWAMHTTFIPTLLYLAIIIFCWIGKMFILPVAAIFKRGGLVEKPHNLTAGVFAFVTVVFGVIGGCIDKTIDSTPTPQEKKTVSQQTFETNEKAKSLEKRLSNP